MYLLAYLRTPQTEGVHWEHGEIAGAILGDDFSVKQDLGCIFKPNPKEYWRSHRLLAGNIIAKDQNSVYFFHGGSPNHPNLLDESIGFSKGVIKDSKGFVWETPKLINFIDWEKNYDYCDEPNYTGNSRHHQWRDPYVIYHENKYWMFISAAAKTNSSFAGCVGLAVSDSPEGPYQTLPPVVFPTFKNQSTEEGMFYECERSHVVYKEGKWHLFFSTYLRRINLDWFETLGKDKDLITDSTLYHFISPNIEGPYLPAEEIPVVQGSSQTEIFATNFVANQAGGISAYGSCMGCLDLDVSGQWQVLWDNDKPRIEHINAFGNSVSSNLPPLFTCPGYQVWDAIILNLSEKKIGDKYFGKDLNLVQA